MSKSDLLAGVIGGLGPEATVDFMARIIALTPAENDQDHVRLLVDQNPKVPNRQEAILGDGVDPGPDLAAMAVRLENAGCDFLLMPCNAAHAYEDAIVEATRIPFISIIGVTVDAVPEEVSAIGILETPACWKIGKYQAECRARGLNPITLEKNELEDLIRLVNEIKAGARGTATRAGMKGLAESLVSRGAEIIVVACTEIPLVLDASEVSVPLISSTDELARICIALARGEQVLPRR